MRRSILAGLAFVSTIWGQEQPKEIVKRSISNYIRDWRTLRKWAWTETDTVTSEDTKHSEVSQVMPLYGTPYERLIRKNGRPLNAEEQKKEQHKYEKTLQERKSESAAARTARIRRYEDNRAFIAEVPEAYNFKLEGEETIQNRPAWVISLTPRSGFTPAAAHAALLEHISGKLWVDKQDYQWAKAEAHVIDTINIGWILARVGPGTNFRLEQTPTTNGLWTPTLLAVYGAAHILVFHTKSLNEEVSYSGYCEAKSVSASVYQPSEGR